jgi:transcriptional regulator with XRE-family HTH domain
MEKQELKQRRERLGLTQAEFAKILGVANNTISRYETGQVNIPEYMNLVLEAMEARQIEKLKKPVQSENS